MTAPERPDRPERAPGSGSERELPELPELVRAWAAHEPGRWGTAPAAYEGLARRFLRGGEPLLAYEVVVEGLERAPGDPALRHLQGLALARAGATRAAQALAVELEHEIRAAPDGFEPALQEEVLALLGRTHKDLAAEAGGERERREHLGRALAAYTEGARRSGGFYAAINAAAVALLLGDTDVARTWAALAARRVEEGAAAGAALDHWSHATLGEAALILGDEEEARLHYGRAAAAAARDFADVASMRRQARLVAGAAGATPGWIEAVLRVPPVVLFPGAPLALSRPDPLAATLAAALAAGLAAGWVVGLSAAEIVFLEAVQAVGGATGVVLACRPGHLPPPEGDDGAGWSARREAALRSAAEVVIASHGAPPVAEPVREYADLLAVGLARLQARALETELLVLSPVGAGDASPAAERARRWSGAGCRLERLAPAPGPPA